MSPSVASISGSNTSPPVSLLGVSPGTSQVNGQERSEYCESGGGGGARVQPAVSLVRNSLIQATATGSPTGGTFNDTISAASGTPVTVGYSDTSNPSTISLIDPNNPSPSGQPSPGALGSVIVNYTLNAQTGQKIAHIPTFGMSCYDTALQSDWGSPPNSCSQITYLGTVYAGSVPNPFPGGTGSVCNSFQEEIKIQGEGQLNDGTLIKWISPNFVKATSVTGHDGSALVAGQTVARSLSIIAGTGVHLAIDTIGTNVLANDTGGGITGYRLDLYNGAGDAKCSAFNNKILVSACNPGSASCPGNDIE